MWHSCYIVFVLQCGSYGNRSGTAAHTCALVKTNSKVFVYIFAAMGGDIDVLRVKFTQCIHRLIKLLNARSFQRGQYLKRKRRFIGAFY